MSMELKQKWEEFRCRRLSQTDIKEFDGNNDCRRYQACAEYIRSAASVKQLYDEIKNTVTNHRCNVRDLARRFRTTEAFRKRGEDFYEKKLPIEALQSIDKAILESPLALLLPLPNRTSCKSGQVSNETPGERTEELPYSCCCRRSNKEVSTPCPGRKDREDFLTAYKQSLAECYALRGKLLLNRNQPKEAGVDFKLCLSVHPCRPLQCTLYFLLGESLRQQGLMDESRDAYEKCLALLSNVEHGCNETFELPNKESIVRILAALENGNVKSYHGPHSNGCPSLAKGESESLAYGSVLIKVNSTEEKGRFLEANGKIKAGDTLIVEKPYAAVLLPEYFNTHCYHCLDPVVVPYPCMQCQNVRFCSPDCSVEAWNLYHETECRIWPMIEMVDALTHLSIRSLLVSKQEEVLDVIKHIQETGVECHHMPGFNSSGIYKGDYRAVYDLVTNTSLQPQQALFSFSLTAAVITPFLAEALGCIANGSLILMDKAKDGAKKKSSSWENLSVDRNPSPNIVNVNSIAAAFSRERSSSYHNKLRQQSQSLDDFSASSDPSFQSCYCRGDHSSLFADIFSSCGGCPLSLTSQGVKDSICPLTETQLGTLVLHHLQQMSCNVFAVTKFVTSQGSRSENDVDFQSTRRDLKRVAVALYPTACLLNHSCDPDVIVSFHGSTMVVKATHNIQPGEEITHCYGPHVGHMIRAARQKMLRNQYYFTCRCGACRRDEELEREQMCRLALLCPVCRGAMKVAFAREGYVGTCSSHLCGNVSSVAKELQIFKETIDELAEAVAVGRQGEARRSLSLLQAVLRKRSSILLSKDKFVGEVHDRLSRCYAVLGDWSLASYHCSLNIESVEYQCGPTSAELAHELHRLSQFLVRGKYVEKALNVIERSIKLLSMHYGRDYPDVKNLLKIRHNLRDFNSPMAHLII